MRNASPALIALLNSADQLQIADVLTVIPLSGSSTYLTSASTDVTVVSQVDSASHTFKAGGVDAAGTYRPSFSRGVTKFAIGTEVDQTQIALMTNVLATVGGVPWTQAARNGYFDGARICLERAFSATWGDWSPGTIIVMWALVGQVSPTRNTVNLNIVSDLVRLQRPMPRNVYQQQCLHSLFDAGCTLNRASFAVSGTVQSGSTASSINTNLSQATGYFELGTITFTSGVNNGLVRTVKTFTHSGGVVVPTATLPAAPANGDTFSIVPGCDKLVADASGDATTGTCKVKFNNLVHGRAYPFVPTPEASS